MKEISDLQAGKAGEYLVCADLILSGVIAFPSEQGLPFDIVADIGGKLLKVQVKTTRGPKSIPQRKTSIPAYIFHIGINGKNAARKKYSADDVDMFALVALDTKTVSYMPHFDTQTTMNFRVPAYRGQYHDEQGSILKGKVAGLRAGGESCAAIAEELGLTRSTVYRYSSNLSIEQRGTNSGIYFDSLTLERCLCALK